MTGCGGRDDRSGQDDRVGSQDDRVEFEWPVEPFGML